MERYAWKAKVAEGMRDEYIRRHDELWPEMAEELKRAGIRNYSIWLCGHELFGYYECEKGRAYAAEVHAASRIIQKWDEYMADILIHEPDPETGQRPVLTQVFYLP
jgi:L-rhamnose mutarotase